MSTKQVADFLGVSKKTLMRWDEKGIFPAEREEVSKSRIYYRPNVEKAKMWLDLRERHRKHLRKLPDIRKRLDEVLRMHPVIPGQPVKPWGSRDISVITKAIDAMEKWDREEREIVKGYDQFLNWRFRKIERTGAE